MKKILNIVACAAALIFGSHAVLATTADATYTSTFNGTSYTYDFSVTNTSPGFDIYAIGIGYWEGVPLDPNPANQTFVSTSLAGSPPAPWFAGIPPIYGGDASFGTNWTGNPVTSGYILAGQTLSGFKFSSPTPPPASAPFVVDFYDNNNTFGYAYNGTAYLVNAPVPEPGTYAMLLAGLGLMGLIASRRQPA